MSAGVAGMARDVDALVLALARLAGAAAGLAFVCGTTVERALEDGTVADLTGLADAHTELLAALADRVAAGRLAFDERDDDDENGG